MKVWPATRTAKNTKTTNKFQGREWNQLESRVFGRIIYIHTFGWGGRGCCQAGRGGVAEPANPKTVPLAIRKPRNLTAPRLATPPPPIKIQQSFKNVQKKLKMSGTVSTQNNVGHMKSFPAAAFLAYKNRILGKWFQTTNNNHSGRAVQLRSDLPESPRTFAR